MLTPEQALGHATDLIARATRAGADAADALYVSGTSADVQVREGRLEDVGRAENSGIGLRAFVGQRSASASSSDLSVEALAALVERVVAMARAAPEDPYAGLADPALLLRGAPADLEIDDGGTPVPPEVLRETALAAEAAAFAVPGVTQSMGSSASQGRSVVALATSTGFAGAYAGSSHSIGVSALAGEGADKQRNYWSHTARFRSDLEDAATIGRTAGEGAVARLNPIRLPSGAMPVVFAPRVSNTLVGHFLGAITGGAIARGTSFLKDRLGQAVFAPGIDIIDDPMLKKGLRSKPYDGEGLPTRRCALIDNGVLTQWMAEAASARQLGIAPTGHAARGLSGAPGAGATNTHMSAGAVTPDALIADIAHGFYVTELIGMGVNGLTGDYSRGAAGFEIVNGVIGRAVAEVTIAGNLTDMFAAARPADDLEFRYATNAPTVRIDGMTLAGA